MLVIKVMADITTEIWPVSSRQIAEKDHSSDLDKDVVPSSSEGQMMIGGQGSRGGVEDRFARRDWTKCTVGSWRQRGTRWWWAPGARLR